MLLANELFSQLLRAHDNREQERHCYSSVVKQTRYALQKIAENFRLLGMILT